MGIKNVCVLGYHISIKYNNILKILVYNKINNTHANYTENLTFYVLFTINFTFITDCIIKTCRI